MHSEVDSVLIASSDTSRRRFWAQLPLHESTFCDLTLQSSDGVCLDCHRLILSMASESFRKLLTSDFAEVRTGKVVFDFPTCVLRAFLDMLYKGQAQVARSLLPELLCFVHQWDIHILMRSLNSAMQKYMSAELCSSLIVECDLQLSSVLTRLVSAYACEHFAACVATASFTSWPLHWLTSILQRDDLTARNEEEVLQAVLRWYRGGSDRQEATATLLHLVRFPLLSVSSLSSVRLIPSLTGLAGIQAARLAEDALSVHSAPPRACRRVCRRKRPASPEPQRQPRPRRGFGRWWADLGCSVKGGIVIPGLEFPHDEQPWGLCVHSGSVYVISSKEVEILWRLLRGLHEQVWCGRGGCCR
eukprot:TRINITY_DN58409_c0_g1_i2.p1 TRINITY_DN58409_c0_g1~~TRINITY_DN58409_c0_g1_i2.p1  ORF type:complete len:359 (+),score=40.61 TRINITY_DN58409_c0_g1_i2:17-1093(+)